MLDSFGGKSFVIRETSKQFSVRAVAQIIASGNLRRCFLRKATASSATSAVSGPFPTQFREMAGNIAAGFGGAKIIAQTAIRCAPEPVFDRAPHRFRPGNFFLST